MIDADKIKEAIRSAAPRARLEWLREFWGACPPAGVASQLEALERILAANDGKATHKADLLLDSLAHAATVSEWRRERQKPAEVTNAKFVTAREFARNAALEMLADDNLQSLRKADILESVSANLIRVRQHCPNDRVLWDWLTAAPSVIPEYMRRGGRPPKQET